MSNLNLFRASVELLVPMKVLTDRDKFEQLVPVKLFDWQQLKKAREFAAKTEGQLYTWQNEDCANFLNKGAHWVNALFVAIVPSEYKLPDFVELTPDSGYVCPKCRNAECEGECHNLYCECENCHENESEAE